MRTLLTLSLLLISQVAVENTCHSGVRTQGGACCSLCPLGFGVSVPCQTSNTVCEPCTEGSTFSDVSNGSEPCRPCSRCQGTMQTVNATCTTKRDTICHCPDGYYLHPGDGGSDSVCLACHVCAKGSGAKMPCTRTENTECQPCPPGSYSEVKSSRAPCLPCRPRCQETEVQIGDCTPHHDILCMDKDVPILKRKDDNSTMYTSLEEGNKDLSILRRTDGSGPIDNTTVSGSPQFISPEDNSKNIIPVYCSILAAVVVGLIGYVAFKCWVTCKQKKLLAKQRAGELAASGEGEKLHSDSGVFLDTHSLQEQNQLNKAKLEPKLYINLPPHKQEEVECLLTDTSRGKDWQRLASLLGYEEDTIDTFARGEDPVHTLLTNWSSKESSTLEVLCAALVNMERADVVDTLNSTADGSSVV